MFSVFGISVLASLPQLVSSPVQTPARIRTDQAAVALQLRARSTSRLGSTASSSTAFASPRAPYSTGQGRRIAYMIGADNAECVRSVPDVNGDGRDEILVGIGKSGVDNVFCLDGSSVGAASVVWQFQTLGGVSNGMVYGDQSIVPASDADGDGAADVLIGTSWGGRTAYSFDTLGGSERWRYDTYVN